MFSIKYFKKLNYEKNCHDFRIYKKPLGVNYDDEYKAKLLTTDKCYFNF